MINELLFFLKCFKIQTKKNQVIMKSETDKKIKNLDLKISFCYGAVSILALDFIILFVYLILTKW